MAKRMMYSFEEKKNPFNGIASTLMGIVSLLVMLAMIYTSYYMRGNAGVYAGAFGLTGLLFAFVGFILGIISFSEKNSKHKYPKIGSVLCGVDFAVWLGLFLMGM